MVRVDSRRLERDFPPAGLNTDGVPTGGWWNYSGIQREVYLRRLDTVDFQRVQVRPVIDCGTCAASVEVQINLRNVTRERRARDDHRPVRRPHGPPGHQGDRAGRDRGVHGHGADREPAPVVAAGAEPLRRQLHRPRGRPQGRGLQRSTAASARSRSRNGRLVLNGQFLNARGVGLHEESKAAGFAIDNARRDQLVNEAKALGATVLRTHYPLHPYTHELADRLGLLIWSEIPVYSVSTEVLKEPTVRRLAVKELSRNIEANENHASVMVWSIGNELSSQPGPVQTAYIAAATKFAKEMDPTRPVGLAVAAYPSSLCQAERVQADRRARPQRLLRLVPGPERPDLRPHEALRRTSTRPAPATRTRR